MLQEWDESYRFETIDAEVEAVASQKGPLALFEAVARALRLEEDALTREDSARRLRNEAVDYLDQHRERYAPLLRAHAAQRIDEGLDLDGDLVEQAIAHLRSPEAYVGIETVQAATAILRRPIRLLRPGMRHVTFLARPLLLWNNNKD